MKRGAPKPPARDVPELIYGVHAGLAVFTKRREDILRVGYAREVRDRVEALVRWAATARVPCDELDPRELDRITESTHHEGLVLQTRPRTWMKAQELGELLASRLGAAIALDRVRNPHNIGAILRSAAFFGIDALLLGSPAPHPGLAPSAVRVAQGGAEHVAVARTTDLADTLGRVRARGVRVVGTDAQARVSASEYDFARPTIIVLGNEREGLGDRIRAQVDVTLAIRGTGAIDSLNVAVASGVLMAELARRRT